MAGALRRVMATLALAAGLFLFGVSVLALGIEAAEVDPRPLDPSSLTSANGSALLAYHTEYSRSSSRRIEVSYLFPEAPGDVFVVACDALDPMRRGEAPAAPWLAFTQVQEGSFIISPQTLPPDARRALVVDPRTGIMSYCDPVLAFRWDVAGNDTAANQPRVDVTYHSTAFDQGRHWLILVLMTAGSTLVLVGGLGLARHRSAASPPSADESPLEMLRASLERMGEQLEATRRHLLFAGVLGVFLWYPVLVPWAWRRAAATDVGPVFPWAVAGLTLAFLAVLTLLWARALHRLDRELHAWRGRMGQLRDREASLMETFEQGR